MGGRTQKDAKSSGNKRLLARANGARTKQQAGGNAVRIPKKPQLDYSVRYGDNYNRECAIARTKLEKHGNKCCCCLKRKFKELHHTNYGRNYLGVNWFPVCQNCHDRVCHNTKNWVQDNKNPVWGNKNTE